MLGLLPALLVVELGVMAVSWVVLICVLEEDMMLSDVAIIVVVVVVVLLIVDNIVEVTVGTTTV